MDLRSSGTSEIATSYNDVGPHGTVERDTVRWTRYRNPDRLVLEVTAVRYEDGTGQPVPEPTDACWLADGSTQPGQSSVLRVAAPHMLQELSLADHSAPVNPNDEDGNFWCGVGLAERYLRMCGA
jgi:hypothetical protein